MVTRRRVLQTGIRAGLGLGTALLAAQYGNGVDPGVGLRNGPQVIAAQAAGTPILQLFYRGSDSQLWTLWQKADRSWSNAISLGGSVSSDPVAEKVPGTDILHVFYRGTDRAVWTQSRTPDGHWPEAWAIAGSDYQKGPDLMGAPVAAADPNANTLHVFYRGTDNGLWTLSRTSDGMPDWPTGIWSDIGSLAGNVAGDVCTAVVPA
jgi:hypothetical protein